VVPPPELRLAQGTRSAAQHLAVVDTETRNFDLAAFPAAVARGVESGYATGRARTSNDVVTLSETLLPVMTLSSTPSGEGKWRETPCGLASTSGPIR
jgi:hypothetical protein